MSKHSTLKSLISEMVRKELKSILSEQSTSSSPTSSLSPGAQKALEQSKIAKQNKDVQKKRAAAKQSMRGMSVESADPTVEEQFSRMPGDKRQSDEVDFFDTSELHVERDHDDKWDDQFDFDFAPADEIGLYDEVPGVTSSPEDFMDPYPEDESVKLPEQRMFDDDTDDADIFTNSTEEKFFSAKAPPRVPGKSLSVDELESSLVAPEDEIDIDWSSEDDYDYLSDKTVTPLDPTAQDRFAQAEWEEDEAEFERSGGSRRMDMELEQIDNTADDLEDEKYDALKREMDYQAWLDAEKEEDDFQRSGGGRRADWEWQY